MKLKFDHVFQFKVTLRATKPPIWRRIQVPCDYSFWDLHVAIQDSMGWLDCHLHQFDVPFPLTGENVRIGIPLEEEWPDQEPMAAGWEIPIAAFFTLLNRKAKYEYDFGDSWEHNLLLEKVFPRPKGADYPACTGGKRACPPEDCGGTWGYQEFLEAISDPAHEEHQRMLNWVGGSFHPERFAAKAVAFDDPHERWERAFKKR